jgi:carboxyl-terminal processing protease
MGFATRALLPLALSVLAGCGGGGGGNGGSSGLPSNPSGGNGGNSGYTAGVFPASSTFASQCAAPRAGTTDRTGTTFTENMFLRSWTNELYLWYREVPDRDPSGFTTEDYFHDVLMTTQRTGSGRPKDQFHFTYPTDVWQALSQSGIEVGYGAQFMLLARTPPRKIVVAFVEPGTPAAAASANLTRGVEVLYADGIDVVNANTQTAVDILNAALFPTTAGTSHTFLIREPSGATREVTMTPVAITHDPVPVTSVIDPTGVPVGYMLFNDHIATSESALIDAVNQLRAANVQDLVLDLRYNGGGYLDIASELAYMIAGGARTSGLPFERLVFNDKYPSTNPVTGQPLVPTPFHTTAQGFNVPRGTSLPTLNLNRVYVITGNNTCSASESIINGLRGVGLEVYQIGSTTCGKPYGFYPQNNCGTTYFSIQFQGLNAAGFGDYADGFTPQNSTNASTARLNGCAVADDFTSQLGDVNEARLRAALAYRASNNQTCPAASGTGPDAQLKGGRAEVADGVLMRTPMRENRILRDGPYEPPSSATRVRMLTTPEPRE